jgi:hypothetical protein
MRIAAGIQDARFTREKSLHNILMVYHTDGWLVQITYLMVGSVHCTDELIAVLYVQFFCAVRK